MDNSFLNEILGKDGASTLNKAVDRIPSLKSVVTPRAVVAWVSTVGNLGFDGELPGTPDSYFSLVKNEKNNYDGALTINNQLYTFEDADLLHISASVGVALGIDLDPIDERLKSKDLTKLGKSIDLLVKSQIIKKAQASGIKMSQHGDFHVEHTGAPATPYAIKHSASNQVMLDRVGTLDQAKSIANWYSSKKLTKTKPAESAEDHGKPNPPQEPFEHGEAVAPSKQLGRTDSMDEPFQKEWNLHGGQGRTEDKPQKMRISKSESEKTCSECGIGQFNQSKFVGCLCLRDLAGHIKVEKSENDLMLHFDSTMDIDSIETLVDIFKN